MGARAPPVQRARTTPASPARPRARRTTCRARPHPPARRHHSVAGWRAVARRRGPDAARATTATLALFPPAAPGRATPARWPPRRARGALPPPAGADRRGAPGAGRGAQGESAAPAATGAGGARGASARRSEAARSHGAGTRGSSGRPPAHAVRRVGEPGAKHLPWRARAVITAPAQALELGLEQVGELGGESLERPPVC